jgi:hypothetical protein
MFSEVYFFGRAKKAKIWNHFTKEKEHAQSAEKLASPVEEGGMLCTLYMSRPLAPRLSRLVSDIPVSPLCLLYIHLQNRRLSKKLLKLGVLNEDGVYS